MIVQEKKRETVVQNSLISCVVPEFDRISLGMKAQRRKRMVTQEKQLEDTLWLYSLKKKYLLALKSSQSK